MTVSDEARRMTRRIAAARMMLGITTLQTRFSDRNGEWSLSDLFNEIEAALSQRPSPSAGKAPSDDDLILRRDAFAVAQTVCDQSCDADPVAIKQQLHTGIADIPAKRPSPHDEGVDVTPEIDAALRKALARSTTRVAPKLDEGVIAEVKEALTDLLDKVDRMDMDSADIAHFGPATERARRLLTLIEGGGK